MDDFNENAGEEAESVVSDSKTTQAEFAAIKTVYDALAPLPPQAQGRVYSYIGSLLSIERQEGKKGAGKKQEDEEVEVEDEETDGTSTFSDFAELHEAARPNTQADRALLAGYWLQECQGQENFTAAAAQRELNNLGLKLPNITSAIDTIRTSRPALILQLGKSGSSKQARKKYKLSVAGITRVKGMISGG